MVFCLSGSVQSTRTQRERVQVWTDESLLPAGQVRRVRPDYEVGPGEPRSVDEESKEMASTFTLETAAVVRLVRHQT